MAILKSLNENIYFEIQLGEISYIASEKWQNVNLNFNSLWHSLNIKSYPNNENHLSYLKDQNQVKITNTGTLVLCLSPENEITNLSINIDKLLNQEIKKLSFEPLEPSFELNIKLNDALLESYIVEVWLDLTNFLDGFYLGDAIGSRFYTNKDNIKQFKHELLTSLD